MIALIGPEASVLYSQLQGTVLCKALDSDVSFRSFVKLKHILFA